MASAEASTGDFGEFKTSLEGYLTTDHCSRLCALFNFKPAQTEYIVTKNSPGLELLNILTQRKTINEHDVTKLETSLRKLDLNTAADIVAAFQNSVGKRKRKTEDGNYLRRSKLCKKSEESEYKCKAEC